MEAQIVAVDADGSIKDAFVLDVEWRGVRESILSEKGRRMMAESLSDEAIDRTPMPLDAELAGRLAAYKASFLPGETKWSRTQKTEALNWMAAKWDASRPWEKFCEGAKEKFKIFPKDPLEEYNWFSSCLFLKQLLDFIERSRDWKAVVAPVAPMQDA